MTYTITARLFSMSMSVPDIRLADAQPLKRSAWPGERVYAVIPAYNEGSAITAVVEDTLCHVDGVVVVDDASTDGTARMALCVGVNVLRHSVNLGQGASLQTGIAFALACGATHVVTLDADGQHDPAQIGRMLAAMREMNVEAALGSRFKGETIGMPRFRRAILKLAVIFTRLTTGLKVTDSHNGFRVFSAAAAGRLQIRQNRMAHASEILDEIAKKRISFVEVPVTIRYTDYSLSKGQSNLNSLNILLDLALQWLRK